MFPYNLYVEVLTLSTSDYDFKEVNKLKEVIRVGPNAIRLVSFLEEEIWTQIQEGRPREDTGRRWLLTSQGERPQRKPTVLTPLSWTSGLQNCEKMNLCCLSPLVCVLCYDIPSKPIH